MTGGVKTPGGRKTQNRRRSRSHTRLPVLEDGCYCHLLEKDTTQEKQRVTTGTRVCSYDEDLFPYMNRAD